MFKLFTMKNKRTFKKVKIGDDFPSLRSSNSNLWHVHVLRGDLLSLPTTDTGERGRLELCPPGQARMVGSGGLSLGLDLSPRGSEVGSVGTVLGVFSSSRP